MDKILGKMVMTLEEELNHKSQAPNPKQFRILNVQKVLLSLQRVYLSHIGKFGFAWDCPDSVGIRPLRIWDLGFRTGSG
jgi:hypothetical protein